MKVGMAIATLGHIASTVKDLNGTERLSLYGAYMEIERTLKNVAIEKNLHEAKINEELGRFKWSMESISGLDDGNNRSETQHISWMYGAVSALESDICFGNHMDAA